MSNKFKEGDRVRILRSDYVSPYLAPGKLGTVREYWGYPTLIEVIMDESSGPLELKTWPFEEHELEVVA